MDRMIVLILLSFALCLAMSILGGIIAGLIIINSSDAVEFGVSGILSETMFSQSTPIILSEIFSRIPVNIIDRLLSAYCGFLIAHCLKFIFKISAQKP